MAYLFLFDNEPMPEGPSNGYGKAQNPARGYLELSEQLVKNTRNANGELIAQPIGKRRLVKFDSLKWPYLSREQVKWLKQKVSNFKVNVTYFDSEEDKVITRMFYFGDMSAEPCDWDRSGTIMIPTYYKDVKVNIIDCGF